MPSGDTLSGTRTFGRIGMVPLMEDMTISVVAGRVGRNENYTGRMKNCGFVFMYAR